MTFYFPVYMKNSWTEKLTTNDMTVHVSNNYLHHSQSSVCMLHHHRKKKMLYASIKIDILFLLLQQVLKFIIKKQRSWAFISYKTLVILSLPHFAFLSTILHFTSTICRRYISTLIPINFLVYLHHFPDPTDINQIFILLFHELKFFIISKY